MLSTNSFPANGYKGSFLVCLFGYFISDGDFSYYYIWHCGCEYATWNIYFAVSVVFKGLLLNFSSLFWLLFFVIFVVIEIVLFLILYLGGEKEEKYEWFFRELNYGFLWLVKPPFTLCNNNLYITS